MKPSEIAAIGRKNLKTALPGFKFRVTTFRKRITVEVLEAPAGFVVKEPHTPSHFPLYAQRTSEANAVARTIEKIFAAHIHDTSDPSTDYFNFNAYVLVEFKDE